MDEQKTWRVITALLISLVSAGALMVSVFWAPHTARATDLTVCPAGPPDCQYTSIQAAVDDAGIGSVIKVAAGTYSGVNNYGGLAQVVYVSKTVTIRGGYTTAFAEPPDPENNHSILDAEGLGRVLYISGDISPTVEGLCLTGGDATGLGGGPYGDAGGAVYLHQATATISNCLVYSNTASTANWGYGGGLYLWESDATLQNNRVQDNTGSTAFRGDGGGLCLRYSDALLQGNTVISNTAGTAQEAFGGGLYLEYSPATLQENTVQGNTASTAASGYAYGGGLCLHYSDARLQGNIVISNTTSTGYRGDGGGLRLFESDATLQGNTVQGNTASLADRGNGGGLCLYQSVATLENNTVVSNTAATANDGHGGGLLLQNSPATVQGNVVQGNIASKGGKGYGGGLDVRASAATLQGNTVRGNTGSTASYGWAGGLYLYYSDATVEGNTVQDNTASTARDAFGGGLVLEHSAAAVQGNMVKGNTASRSANGYGGGLYLTSSPAALSGNTVVSNTATLSSTATGQGGALWAEDSIPFTLTNNLVADNHANTEGSGLWLDQSSGRLLHTTIADNHSSGQGVFLASGSTLVFTNTIIAGHDSVGITVMAGSTVTLEATLWHANGSHTAGSGTISTGTVNLDGDPAFVDPASWDYHLGAGSAAADQGVDAGITADIDGQPRPNGLGYDIGADEFYVCEAVSNASLQRSPAGDLSAGNTVRFSAWAVGTTPFAYAWTLNGSPVGDNRDTFEHAFDLSGTYTVGVTLTNFCGQDSASMVVEVQEAAPGQPDLSLSDKSASLSTVQDADTVIYTVILRNAGETSATVTLTDPIPLHTDYVPGSAQASDGNPVTWDGAELAWSGQVISGTPVLMTFAVHVNASGLAIGSHITNTAYVDDGLGHLLSLATQSLFNPGYGLIINEGASFTNNPLVTLRYAWNAGDDIEQVQFSNDRGFLPGPDTSAWIAVDPVDPVFENWALDTDWLPYLPCTVYARFRDSGGGVHGPVRDSIIYDRRPPRPPTIGFVVGRIGGDAGENGLAGTEVALRVTGSDANSGVDRVQVSHQADLATFTEFPFVGPTTDIPWTLQASGKVYVRVVDRAGNLSEVSSGQGPTDYYKIYLPFVLHAYP